MKMVVLLTRPFVCVRERESERGVRTVERDEREKEWAIEWISESSEKWEKESFSKREKMMVREIDREDGFMQKYKLKLSFGFSLLNKFYHYDFLMEEKWIYLYFLIP